MEPGPTPEFMPEFTPEPAPEVNKLSFEQAIAATYSLLDQLEQGAIAPEDLESSLAALVATENGARGFFVTYLSDERSLADQASPAILRALQASPEIVSELLVKNLAMSSAMAIAHRRNADEDLVQGSERVRSRTATLIQQLQLPLVADKARQLHESATTGTGHYKAFLDRWGYDAEQRQEIQSVIERVMPIQETPAEDS